MAEPGLTHRFPMLKRAAGHLAKTGRFDEALKIVEEMFSLAPSDPGLSRLKARFAADLVKQAVQHQKIEAAARILDLVEARIPPDHLGDAERALLARVREEVVSL